MIENWRASLKRQRLKPYEDFAKMIESRLNGIASFIPPKTEAGVIDPGLLPSAVRLKRV